MSTIAEAPVASTSKSDSEDVATFGSLEPQLHPLLLRSLSLLEFATPTPIQQTLIPLALSSNRDILARARTGSGKTLAYAIPIVQGILRSRDAAASSSTAAAASDPAAASALVLVPTRELAAQVTAQMGHLIEGLGLGEELGQAIKVVNASALEGGRKRKRRKAEGENGERSEALEHADVVIATPAKALTHLRDETLKLDDVRHIVIDEADLILSYGHSSDDIRSILAGPWSISKTHQSFLMSATMTSEVDELRGIILRKPIVLKLEEDEDELANLSQYCLRCSEEEKFLLLYVILKLKLIKGKSLIFVNNIDRGYRVKLFLQNFGIKSGVLNSELPFNSRYHAVQEFNRGVFDYLIATDESGVDGTDGDSDNEGDEGESGLLSTQPVKDGEEGGEEDASRKESKKRKRGETSKPTSATEYGVSRGIDFVDVACVVNFDLPFSARSYTHRVGRTARAGRTGTALSFIVPKKMVGTERRFDIVLPSAKRDEKVWRRIERAQATRGAEIKEYEFDMKQVEGFRYRMEDALRAVTKATVREARIKEIKNEVLNSEKLKAHFEDNPRDLAFLRHDKPLHTMRSQPHLKHVPQYLMPRIANVNSAAGTATVNDSAAGTSSAASRSSVPFHKHKKGPQRGARKRQDPLKGGKLKGKKR